MDENSSRDERESRTEYLFKIAVRWMVFFAAAALVQCFCWEQRLQSITRTGL